MTIELMALIVKLILLGEWRRGQRLVKISPRNYTQVLLCIRLEITLCSFQKSLSLSTLHFTLVYFLIWTNKTDFSLYFVESNFMIDFLILNSSLQYNSNLTLTCFLEEGFEVVEVFYKQKIPLEQDTRILK